MELTKTIVKAHESLLDLVDLVVDVGVPLVVVLLRVVYMVPVRSLDNTFMVLHVIVLMVMVVGPVSMKTKVDDLDRVVVQEDVHVQHDIAKLKQVIS